jgi:ERCC4-related helicase
MQRLFSKMSNVFLIIIPQSVEFNQEEKDYNMYHIISIISLFITTYQIFRRQKIQKIQEFFKKMKFTKKEKTIQNTIANSIIMTKSLPSSLLINYLKSIKI